MNIEDMHNTKPFAEAGGVVCDAEGKALDFSKGKYLAHKTGIIVTTKKLKPWVLKAVRESMEEENIQFCGTN